MSELDFITLQHDAEVQINSVCKGFNIADSDRNAHGKWMYTGAYRVYMSIVYGRGASLSDDIELTTQFSTELSHAVKAILNDIFRCKWFVSFMALTDAEGYGTANETDARYVVAELRR